jgi:hypothetical protein
MIAKTFQCRPLYSKTKQKMSCSIADAGSSCITRLQLMTTALKNIS